MGSSTMKEDGMVFHTDIMEGLSVYDAKGSTCISIHRTFPSSLSHTMLHGVDVTGSVSTSIRMINLKNYQQLR